jgi:hypothetical protein
MYAKRQTKRLMLTLPVAIYNVLHRNRYSLNANQIINHIIMQALTKPLAPPLPEPEHAPKRMRRVNFLMHAFVYERVTAIITRNTVAETRTRRSPRVISTQTRR